MFAPDAGLLSPHIVANRPPAFDWAVPIWVMATPLYVIPVISLVVEVTPTKRSVAPSRFIENDDPETSPLEGNVMAIRA